MKQPIEIRMPDGVAHAGLFRPADGAPGLPGVILYMDGVGPRPALDRMAQRLADAGYLVLLPDLFYRFGDTYGRFDGAAFANEASRAEIMTMIRGTPQALTERDTAAFLATLTAEGAGRIGAVGYCMGGGRALTAAAAYADRIAAAASFHGGNLASEAADSPHLRAGEIRGRIYVGTAGVDASFPPEQSARLAEALRSGQVDHVVENYVGMAHGWAVPDLPVHDQAGAERHWKRLLTFFGEALNGP